MVIVPIEPLETVVVTTGIAADGISPAAIARNAGSVAVANSAWVVVVSAPTLPGAVVVPSARTMVCAVVGNATAVGAAAPAVRFIRKVSAA